MMKQIPAILLTILCAVLAFLLFTAEQENKALKLELQTKQELAKTARAQIAQTAQAEFQPSENKAPPTEKFQSLENTETNAPEPVAEEKEFNNQQRMMKNVAQMMEENPTLNKVVEASQRGVVGALYGDLIEYLNLNNEESKYFMDLLMHRQMKNVELAMKMMGGELTEVEKAALLEDVKLAGESMKTEMESFLNSEDDFAEYEFYEKTIGERMMLSQIDAKLAATGQSFSDETYRQVLEIMHEERKNFDFTNDLGDNENMDMTAERFSKANIDLFMKETLEMGEGITRRLETILTPEQMKAYNESGAAMLNLQASQLQQAKQMFGGE